MNWHNVAFFRLNENSFDTISMWRDRTERMRKKKTTKKRIQNPRGKKKEKMKKNDNVSIERQ